MIVVDSRDQALSLLTAAINHSDLAVKLSSLKQARDILSSLDSSSTADLFPYVADLQRSPHTLVRKFLLEIIEDIALRTIEHSAVLVPVLVAFLRDVDSDVVKQSIVTGTHFFCSVLEEMTLQYGKVDQWVQELWMWMIRFKEGVFSIALQPGPVGIKLLALKFLETYILLFTPDNVYYEKFEATRGSRRTFNISWLSGSHPILDPIALTSDANRNLFVLLEMLQSASSLPGAVTINIVNCLAAIARKRPQHYATVLSALLDFNPNFETVREFHKASIQYSLRTSFLGFLRCTYPGIVESRERLLRALQAMNAGDASDQVIRQVEKMIKNSERERVSREIQSVRDVKASSQAYILGDVSKKRSMPQDNEELTNSFEIASKRIRSGPNSHSTPPTQISDSGQDFSSVNGASPSFPLLDDNLTPVEQMIAMIGALLAEGERAAESLEILISKIHPDLLAEIVITNMRHLPKSPPLSKVGTLPTTQQAVNINSRVQVFPPVPTNPLHTPLSTPQLPVTSAATTGSSISDTSTVNNFAADSKRDPRRDPRRLDPRRAAVSVGMSSTPVLEDSVTAIFEFDGSISNKPLSVPVVETPPVHSMHNIQSNDKIIEGSSIVGVEQPSPEGDVVGGEEDIAPILEVNSPSNRTVSPYMDDVESAELKADAEVKHDTDESLSPESDQNFPGSITVSSLDETGRDLPVLPLYVELTEEQKRSVRKSAVQQIAESYLHLYWSDCNEMCMALFSRLVGQIDADDDIIVMLGKQIVVDYQQQKGHEIVLQVLYHLYSHTVTNSVDNSSYAAVLYEKFLLEVSKSLLDTLPASDKSFSRLLGEVPFLPDSALKLLDDLCFSDVFDITGKEIRDAERVTQGLGVVWSLILGRPNNRQACLGIVLKCAVHSQDDIRGKAIRLVANKLYQLNYISGEIEKFATNMMLSAVGQRAAGAEFMQSVSIDERVEREVGSGDTSTSGSQLSEPRASGIDPENTESASSSSSVVSLPEAQRFLSLFFALCTKKPSLLQLLFDIYGRAPKVVKQAFHRHIPIVIRALGQSYSQLLRIISDPPQGSENLLTLVLQVLTQEATPSPDLVATVKHLYETKLKDATILIPMLSSLSKNEVLPIFPRLVDLPLEKFQLALAHILQGSAHTGPALTPAEVLVAIHDILPEKGGPPLKKITDACSACFEQRTVFTQQVLAKALNQLVDQVPLPLLFMRTVIQAIDAFPTLVDFVMEILSKLVSKQIWRMPKLWVGFLKCVVQTQPHSFPVLLQLPPPQLESTLNKFGSLRSSLASYASQPNIKGSLPRSTLAILGLANEQHMQPQQQPHMSNLHSSDASSVQGATTT
ncbi:uncharacterized protein LOC120195227 isoform X2 [Hibiscus syriacus]|uniref:uncharacterized protein LOC120195227 isoform X2 n=1 Tax=Hibiscus syriacus TaxID=106335 RepID=UPI0019243FA7|nr:uncharacterized protein LOC120195227 isoform X2 [Hibiscus syriacus]